jgi:hypothetical protein
VIILTKKEVTKKGIEDQAIKEQLKFEDPHKVANKFVDIIAPTFGLKGGLKTTFKTRLKLSKKDELRQCLTDVLRLLATEYKK